MASTTEYFTKDGKKRYRVHYRDPERKQRSKSGFTTKRDALIFAASVIGETKDSYIAPRAGNVTVDDVYQTWLRSMSAKPSTKYGRETTWNKYVQPRWGSVRVKDVDVTAVEIWRNELYENGTRATTIEKVLGVLKGVMDQAVKEKMIAQNSISKVKAPSRKNSRRPYLTHQQVFAIIGQLEAHDGAVVAFLAYTGMRFSEMSALQVQDVNIQKREAAILTAFSEVKGKLLEDTPKSGSSRTVPLAQSIIDMIIPLMEGKSPTDRVFQSANGAVLRNSTFRNRIFTPAVKRCVVEDPSFPQNLTIHDLRHTCASLSISAGASVLSLQRMLGHKKPSITLDVYSDLFDGDLHRVSESLDEKIRELKNSEKVEEK